MNKFELDKVMECFGFDINSYYEIYGCKCYHDGKYFAIINGKTPYKLARLISEKYDSTGLSRIEYNLTDNSFGEQYREKQQLLLKTKIYY